MVSVQRETAWQAFLIVSRICSKIELPCRKRLGCLRVLLQCDKSARGPRSYEKISIGPVRRGQRVNAVSLRIGRLLIAITYSRSTISQEAVISDARRTLQIGRASGREGT